MAYLPISRLIRHLPAIAGNIFNLVKKQANLRRVLILTQVIGLRIVILEKTFLLVNQKYAKKNQERHKTANSVEKISVKPLCAVYKIKKSHQQIEDFF